MSRVVRYTYREYRDLPESETKRYELLEGELVMVPSPGKAHQEAVGNVFACLRAFVKERDLGAVYVAPFDVILSEHTVVQPGVIYVVKSRTHIIKSEGVQGSPDLVVEVISPTTRERDLVTKRLIYGRHGVKEYWLVHPDQRIVEVFRLSGTELAPIATYAAAETLESPLLPGLALPVREIF
ncbi:MAG: Uma2 family endonuclease [Armatimonadetes bacterium]|nr:Uma2 family endonuclease [Armatimonadota bacterium]